MRLILTVNAKADDEIEILLCHENGDFILGAGGFMNPPRRTLTQLVAHFSESLPTLIDREFRKFQNKTKCTP